MPLHGGERLLDHSVYVPRIASRSWGGKEPTEIIVTGQDEVPGNRVIMAYRMDIFKITCYEI